MNYRTIPPSEFKPNHLSLSLSWSNHTTGPPIAIHTSDNESSYDGDGVSWLPNVIVTDRDSEEVQQVKLLATLLVDTRFELGDFGDCVFSSDPSSAFISSSPALMTHSSNLSLFKFTGDNGDNDKTDNDFNDGAFLEDGGDIRSGEGLSGTAQTPATGSQLISWTTQRRCGSSWTGLTGEGGGGGDGDIDDDAEALWRLAMFNVHWHWHWKGEEASLFSVATILRFFILKNCALTGAPVDSTMSLMVSIGSTKLLLAWLLIGIGTGESLWWLLIWLWLWLDFCGVTGGVLASTGLEAAMATINEWDFGLGEEAKCLILEIISRQSGDGLYNVQSLQVCK